MMKEGIHNQFVHHESFWARERERTEQAAEYWEALEMSAPAEVGVLRAQNEELAAQPAHPDGQFPRGPALEEAVATRSSTTPVTRVPPPQHATS